MDGGRRVPWPGTPARWVPHALGAVISISSKHSVRHVRRRRRTGLMRQGRPGVTGVLRSRYGLAS
jgi:hypothetical protein